MSDTETWAVIPSRSRRTELFALAAQLQEQGASVVVVDNGYEPPLEYTYPDLIDLVVAYRDRAPNLSQMWNVGLDAIEAVRGDQVFNVAFLNDDVVLPEGWVTAVGTALRSYNGIAAASSDPYGTITYPLLKRAPDHDVRTRLCPWAFMVRAELGLRADERLEWWYGDTDLDFRARLTGGVIIIPGYMTQNLYANSTTHGELAVRAGDDGKIFKEKWGSMPW